jgi:hypothetical protein
LRLLLMRLKQLTSGFSNTKVMSDLDKSNFCGMGDENMTGEGQVKLEGES